MTGRRTGTNHGRRAPLKLSESISARCKRLLWRMRWLLGRRRMLCWGRSTRLRAAWRSGNGLRRSGNRPSDSLMIGLPIALLSGSRNRQSKGACSKGDVAPVSGRWKARGHCSEYDTTCSETKALFKHMAVTANAKLEDETLSARFKICHLTPW